jgi:ferredoxin
MYILFADANSCRNCGTCSRLLPGFKSAYKGVLQISSNAFHDREEIRECTQSIIDACPTKSISLISRA